MIGPPRRVAVLGPGARAVRSEFGGRRSGGVDQHPLGLRGDGCRVPRRAPRRPSDRVASDLLSGVDLPAPPRPAPPRPAPPRPMDAHATGRGRRRPPMVAASRPANTCSGTPTCGRPRRGSGPSGNGSWPPAPGGSSTGTSDPTTFHDRGSSEPTPSWWSICQPPSALGEGGAAPGNEPGSGRGWRPAGGGADCAHDCDPPVGARHRGPRPPVPDGGRGLSDPTGGSAKNPAAGHHPIPADGNGPRGGGSAAKASRGSRIVAATSRR